MLKTENRLFNKLQQYIYELPQHRFLLHLSIIGALIACRIIYIQHGWINDDAVLYFEAARLFSIGEWKNGWELFSWPIYPLMIAGLHNITALSIQTCAQILTVGLFGLASYSFMRIVSLSGGDKTAIGLSALLLYSTGYITGDVLPMLLRDTGFWASFLTSIVFFIQFYRQQKLIDAFLWQSFAILAMLFRIEAVAYIVLLPFVLFFLPADSAKQRLANFIKAHSLNLSLIILASMALALHGDLSIKNLGRIQEIFSSWSNIQYNFTHTIALKIDILTRDVLGEPLKNFGWMSYILTLLGIVIFKCLSIAGFLPAGVVLGYYTKIKKVMANDARLILSVVALIAFINAVLIISKVNLLSSRYVIAFGFIILIYSAFALRAIFSEFASNSNKVNKSIAIVVSVILALMLFDNLSTKETGYNHEQDAVSFLKDQGIENSKIFFVTPRARYYANAPYAGRGYDYWDYTLYAIEDGSIRNYEYLLIPFGKKQDALDKERIIREKLPEYKVIKTFYGIKKNKKDVIYKRVK